MSRRPQRAAASPTLLRPRRVHMESGRGTTSKAVRFQLRPHPLAN